jgi:hypothetical protein
VLRKSDGICKEFELTYTGEAKDIQASRLGVYKKQLTTVNDRISYYNQDKRQYLYWIKKGIEPGHWMVRENVQLLSLKDFDCHFYPQFEHNSVFIFQTLYSIIILVNYDLNSLEKPWGWMPEV